MAQVRRIQRAFTGGEVSPDMLARSDDATQAQGLARCENLLVLPQGPVANRAGFRFVRAAKYAARRARLIPFEFSTDQTMVLEFGHLYLRFHTDGGTLLDGADPYELVTPYTEDDLPRIHYCQSADVLTLVHPGHAPRELRRLGATNWTLTAITFAPSVTAPGSVTATPSGHLRQTYEYRYRVTSIVGGTESEPAPSVGVQGNLEVLGGVVTLTWDAVPGATDYAVYRLSGGIYGRIGETATTTLVDDGVPPDTTTKPPGSGGTAPANLAAVASGHEYPTYEYRYQVTATDDDGESLPSAAASCTGNLLVDGSRNTITWGAVTGATGYLVYKEQGGVFGYIGRTAAGVTTLVDDNILPDLSQTPPIHDNPFNGPGNYPAAVCYYEQRRAFAGTEAKPQNVWMSRSGTESMLTYSIPTRDDDRIAFRVAARQANTIRHLVPMTDLLILTSGTEWRIAAAGDYLSPSTVTVRPQSYVGASDVQPAIVNNQVLYAAARGGHVRELAYNWQANGYLTGDLCLRSAHLFDGLEIADMAFAKAPVPVLWCVSSSGALLALTYIPEQQVGAWSQHTTAGDFESIAVVAEGAEDALYAVVRRDIDGASVRYIERLDEREDRTLDACFFVDCGLTYDGPAVSEVSGLDHLEGAEVAILADGAVHPRRTVSGGSVTLDRAYSVVHVGLPYVATLQDLPFASGVDGALGQGRAKAVNKAWVRFADSSGLFVGPDLDHLTEYKQRRAEPFGSPPALSTGEVELTLSPAWARDGTVVVQQANPLPLTILSLAYEVTLGGA